MSKKRTLDKAIKMCDFKNGAERSEKLEFLNKMIKYWQDLVYYYQEKGEVNKLNVAKRQLEGYKKAYHNF